MISLNDYLTSSGRYPERAKSPELTPELLAAAQDYVDTANAFFNDLGVQPPPFSSGFRPKSVNAKIANAATLSGHTLCIAGDYEDDKNQSLGKKIIARPDLLRKTCSWKT
jgi:enoyl reductase-like protein